MKGLIIIIDDDDDDDDDDVKWNDIDNIITII
jgi:hypothetical protein